MASTVAQSARPDVAVVIPTRNRRARLAFALEALAGQTLGSERFEVIVVGERGDEIREVQAPEGLSVRFLNAGEGAGPAAKRNIGWRAGSATLVAFTDDDCRPAPDWLAQLLGAATGPARFVQGRTEPDPSEHWLLIGLARSQNIKGPSEWYETCNIAYPRELLERLGGFDESYGLGGEDTDLGLRAREAGAERVYADDALVWHAVLSQPLPAALRNAAERDWLPRLLARHPRQRRAIYRGLFMRRTHALLLPALAGALLLRRRPMLGTMLALPYLDLYFDRGRLTPRAMLRFAVHLPARAAVDATELVVTIRGAIKHRVPIL